MTAAVSCHLSRVRLQGHEVLHDIALDLHAARWTA